MLSWLVFIRARAQWKNGENRSYYVDGSKAFEGNTLNTGTAAANYTNSNLWMNTYYLSNPNQPVTTAASNLTNWTWDNLPAEDEAIPGQDILRVDGIDTSNGVLSITGHDLGVLLDRRYSLYGAEQAAGAQGYDIVEGTTAECVEHYLNNNIINPDNANRKIPLLIFRQNGVPGLPNDSYMARLQQLSVIVNDLCINAGIGYRFSTLAGRYLTFSLRQGVDRSVDQSERGRVILSKNRRNVTALRFSENSENFFNAIYATGSSGADITRPVYRDATPPAGFDRCETAIDVAASDIDDIENNDS